MFFSFLNKPFPRSGYSKRSIFGNFLIGCFVAAFLIVFQPFQINEWNTPYKIYKLAGFGFVSFIAPSILSGLSELLFPKQKTEDSWTVWKEILVLTAVLISVTLGNLVYGKLLHIFPFSFSAFTGMFITTLLIGVFPVTLHVVLKQSKLSKINQTQAAIINEQLHHETPIHDQANSDKKTNQEQPLNEARLTFISENEKDQLDLEPMQLLYIESADNYSNIVYIENKQLKKQMLRSSLKRLESQHSKDYILKCHRTFLVNLKNVKNIEGNAAGYKLSFSHTDFSVPVSRNFGPLVVEKLKLLS